ncbi:hypothetical protein A8L34_28060 [Bacillus sp. FJAT-27264]|uniref:hypothetical protein n=1 Tax=Paenibacillus sp. (strain DSM 101736 / FJAT-27264) TaxID=1850362 RepID=UPI0008081794|nr:hypothetical protein [Bacillus sp. FJAT-27264]OBZ15904.1 hypothetical protein A8L34_28060 [Bacillus sp. FJAT-27264]
MINQYKVPENMVFSTDDDKCFAPLESFLELNMPSEKESILAMMMFMYMEDNDFVYKNRCSRGTIVIDRFGKVTKLGYYALIHFDDHLLNDEIETYVTKRLPVNGIKTCECCGVHPATFFERPLKYDQSFEINACDDCWELHDKTNSLSEDGGLK